MISNLIRKALGPEIENRLNGESIRLNAIINEMENAVDSLTSIRASDIADNISTYDIAADISIDAYDIAKNIDIDADDIEIDYSSLAREISDNIDLNEVNARINNVHTNLETVERKMDLILKHLGITPENA